MAIPNNPIAGLLYRWGTLANLAREMGIDQHAVSKWGLRGRIPPNYWVAFVAAAKRRGYADITIEHLTMIHDDYHRDQASRRRRKPAPLLDRANA